MKQPIEKKKELLFKELDRCLEELKECADLNDVLMPLFYVLYAHKSGILVSIVGDADNIFSHRNRIQPYVDAEGNELTFTGKQKMIDYIKDNPEFRAEYEKAVSDFINKAGKDISLIDEDDLAEIMAAEKGVEETIKKGIEEEQESASKEKSDKADEE